MCSNPSPSFKLRSMKPVLLVHRSQKFFEISIDLFTNKTRSRFGPMTKSNEQDLSRSKETVKSHYNIQRALNYVEFHVKEKLKKGYLESSMGYIEVKEEGPAVPHPKEIFVKRNFSSIPKPEILDIKEELPSVRQPKEILTKRSFEKLSNQNLEDDDQRELKKIKLNGDHSSQSQNNSQQHQHVPLTINDPLISPRPQIVVREAKEKTAKKFQKSDDEDDDEEADSPLRHLNYRSPLQSNLNFSFRATSVPKTVSKKIDEEEEDDSPKKLPNGDINNKKQQNSDSKNRNLLSAFPEKSNNQMSLEVPTTPISHMSDQNLNEEESDSDHGSKSNIEDNVPHKKDENQAHIKKCPWSWKGVYLWNSRDGKVQECIIQIQKRFLKIETKNIADRDPLRFEPLQNKDEAYTYAMQLIQELKSQGFEESKKKFKDVAPFEFSEVPHEMAQAKVVPNNRKDKPAIQKVTNPPAQERNKLFPRHGKWNFEKDPTDWYLFKKRDGIKCTWDGRTIKTAEQEFVPPTDFCRNLPDEEIFGVMSTREGALYGKVRAIMKSNNNDWYDLIFYVEDLLDQTITFEEKLEKLKRLISNDVRQVQLSEYHKITSRNDLEEQIQDLKKKGVKGIILKNKDQLNSKPQTKEVNFNADENRKNQVKKENKNDSQFPDTLGPSLSDFCRIDIKTQGSLTLEYGKTKDSAPLNPI